MSTHDLTERAMLTNLHIHTWGATRTDKKVTAAVAKQHAVSEKRAGRYQKHAINIEAPEFRAVRSAAGELRVRHYFYTNRWSDDGARILPAKLFEEYTREIRRLRGEFQKAVDAFIKAYPTLVTQAKTELNGLFCASDYPADISKKYGVELVIMPLPDAEDFRMDLPKAELNEIREGIEKELERTMGIAMQEPYERLFKHVTRMVQRLENPDGVFRDTLVTGLAELCSILPALNITNDVRLDHLRKRAEEMIEGVSAQMIRDSPKLRADVTEKAAQIHGMMAGFMGSVSADDDD